MKKRLLPPWISNFKKSFLVSLFPILRLEMWHLHAIAAHYQYQTPNVPLQPSVAIQHCKGIHCRWTMQSTSAVSMIAGHYTSRVPTWNVQLLAWQIMALILVALFAEWSKGMNYDSVSWCDMIWFQFFIMMKWYTDRHDIDMWHWQSIL